MARDDIRFTSGNRNNANEKYCVLANEFIENPSALNSGPYRMIGDASNSGGLADEDYSLIVGELSENETSTSNIRIKQSGEFMANEFIEGDFNDHGWKTLNIFLNDSENALSNSNGTVTITGTFEDGTTSKTLNASQFPFSAKAKGNITISSWTRYKKSTYSNTYSSDPDSFSYSNPVLSLPTASNNLSITNNNGFNVAWNYYIGSTFQSSNVMGDSTTVSISANNHSTVTVNFQFTRVKYEIASDSFNMDATTDISFSRGITVTSSNLETITRSSSVQYRTAHDFIYINKNSNYVTLNYSYHPRHTESDCLHYPKLRIGDLNVPTQVRVEDSKITANIYIDDYNGSNTLLSTILLGKLELPVSHKHYAGSIKASIRGGSSGSSMSGGESVGGDGTILITFSYEKVEVDSYGNPYDHKNRYITTASLSNNGTANIGSYNISSDIYLHIFNFNSLSSYDGGLADD